MQEDKLAQQIANSIKKHQEESFHPYEIGAWEKFEKKRKGGGLNIWKLIPAGIAACLVIGMAWWWTVNSTDSQIESTQSLSELKQTEPVSSDGQTSTNQDENLNLTSSDQESTLGGSLNGSNSQIDSFVSDDVGKNSNLLAINSNESVEKADKDVKEFDNQVVLAKSSVTPKSEDFKNRELPWDAVAFEFEKPDLNLLNPEFDPANPNTKPSNFAFFDYSIAKNSENESKIAWEIGLSPAYGGTSSSQNTEVTSNSLGLGMALALEVSDKIKVGTGLAFNSLNQQSQFASNTGNMFASSIAPSKDKISLSQAQMELPLFIQYPLTRNRSISLRAGFSNIYSFNQEVDLESTVTRQVVVSGNGINSSVVRQESVVQKTSLESVNQRFYPFATLNFGLNVRVFQNQQVNYVLMPFYNFPMTDFSGFVENPGMVGATFKVNFMSGEK
ncbi:MAG: hypothetical protein HWE09_11275 [Cyclobacteriaceae bacterium]|nr:hypothetical protein [Cyclobacteriaceae bacterium]